MHPARQIWKMRLIHQRGCNPQSRLNWHTILCGILRMLSKYIFHAMLSYFIALQCYIYVGRQILNCLTLILTRYLHLLPVLLKTRANYSYDRSIAQLLIGGTFHNIINYHIMHGIGYVLRVPSVSIQYNIIILIDVHSHKLLRMETKMLVYCQMGLQRLLHA